MTLVWFIILVGVLITVHELGHLIAARLLGMHVLKFSLGFGPTIVSVRRRGTDYSLSAIPLGGYVRLLGEDGDEDIAEAEKPRAFSLRPAWQRLVVILSGPAANLFFAVVVFTQLYAREATTRSSTIGAVLAGQPAAEADLRPGDRVVAIDGDDVRSWDDLTRRISGSPGRDLQITVQRPGEERLLTKVVTPRVHQQRDVFGGRHTVGLLGIAPHFRLPQIGVVGTDSAAAAAGLHTFDVITSIQGRPVHSTADLASLVAPKSGGMLLVTYLRPTMPPLGFAQVTLLEPGSAQIFPRAVQRSGKAAVFDSGLRPADLFIHSVEPNTPAATVGGMGLHPGDMLLTLDGVAVSSWELFQQTLEEHPETEHQLRWLGSDGEHEGAFHLVPRRHVDEYQAEWTRNVFGAEGAHAILPVPDVPSETNLVAAVGRGIGRAVSVVATLARVVGLILVGKLPATSIGGPLLIYQAAGVAAQHGVEHFPIMAALVSLNIGILNLLPVPLLDGGQATLVLVEALRRRRVDEKLRRRLQYVGVALLLMLLVLALRNDITRP